MRGVLLLKRHMALIAIALVASGFVAGLLVMRTTAAAFSGTWTNANNTWNVGEVALSDTSRYQRRLFNLLEDSRLESDDTRVKCIRLSYDGTLTEDVDVKLYAEPAGGVDALPYLELMIEEGASGRPVGPDDCGTFTPANELVSGITVADFLAGHDDFTTGVGTWTPSAVNEMKAYRFTVTARDVPVGRYPTGAVDFIWEARAG